MNIDRKIVLRFIVIVFISGFFGAVFGGLSGYFGSNEPISLDYLSTLINQYWFYISVVIGCTMTLLSSGIYLRMKRLNVASGDDNVLDILYQRQSSFLYLIKGLSSVNYIIQFLTIILLPRPSSIEALYQLAFAGLILILNMILQVKSINFNKTIHPEKKGHPLDYRFNKDWLKSCDEAEKLIIYKSAYRTFNIMNYAYIIMITLLLLISNWIIIPTIVFIILALLWMISSLTYTYNTWHADTENLQN